MGDTLLSVSDFIALTNQTLEYAYPIVSIVGEVSEYRVAQGKWVGFYLKDEGGVVNCFTSIYNMRTPLEDGMKIVVVGNPRVNPKRGSFAISIQAVKPVGEGSIKKGFELLKAKFEAEGLFSPERKRALPRVPRRVAVITSTESAAYADFTRILNERWGGLSVEVAHTQVQGDAAPDQIIRAIHYFNQQESLPDVLVIIRGGGSAEDLATFNDEPLARAVAESRIPTLVGVGHEVDHTLADMVADVRAATPTHAAETLVPDRAELVRAARLQANHAGQLLVQAIGRYQAQTREDLGRAFRTIQQAVEHSSDKLASLRLVIGQLNPERVLEQGYALIRGAVAVGKPIEIETNRQIIKAEVQHVTEK